MSQTEISDLSQTAGSPSFDSGQNDLSSRPHGRFALDQSPPLSKRLEARQGAISSLYRRIVFLHRYLVAQTHSGPIHKILPILERSFRHPWVAGIELQVRFWPGRENNFHRLLRRHEDLPGRSMNWDAPVTISIFRRRKGKKRQALCMSFYLANGSLCIAQMQGVFRTDVPADLRSWPTLFLRACQTYARENGLRDVRVPQARTLYSYQHPFLIPDALPDRREETLQRIRRNMELLYDGNALALDFEPAQGWLIWENSSNAP
jgi:hypothetical protein